MSRHQNRYFRRSLTIELTIEYTWETSFLDLGELFFDVIDKRPHGIFLLRPNGRSCNKFDGKSYRKLRIFNKETGVEVWGTNSSHVTNDRVLRENRMDVKFYPETKAKH